VHDRLRAVEHRRQIRGEHIEFTEPVPPGVRQVEKRAVPLRRQVIHHDYFGARKRDRHLPDQARADMAKRAGDYDSHR
jgi:hypothetical protein